MNVYKNFPLIDILYYKIGGVADTVLEVQNKEDLLEALDFIQENSIHRVLPIGLGSNLLVNDKPFDGAVLWFNKSKNQSFKIHRNQDPDNKEVAVEAFASELLDDLIQFSFSNNLSGLGWAGGLPSTVGAAVRGNVGCFGSEIKDVFYNAEVFDISEIPYKQTLLTKDALRFSYRNSFVKQNRKLIVSTVYFQLNPSDESGIEQAKKIYSDNIKYREIHHPIEYPSCGSVFKNIVKKEEVEKILSVWSDVKSLSETRWHNKISMGYIIKRLGFSGFKVGEAVVSEKHCNYISNVNHATFDDVNSIIRIIEQKFFEIFAFYPELEVEIVK